MRDSVKKKEDELLVVHKPPSPTDKMGREAATPTAETLPADVERLAARLKQIADAEERKRLLQTIQSRFGNAFAARVVAAFDRTQAGGSATPMVNKTTGSGHP